MKGASGVFKIKWEDILWAFMMAGVVIALVFAMYYMGIKNQMCRDFGIEIYGRVLTWFECLVL